MAPTEVPRGQLHSQSQSLQPLRTLFCLPLISRLSDSFHLFSAQTPKKHSLVLPWLKTQKKFSILKTWYDPVNDLTIPGWWHVCKVHPVFLSVCLYLFTYFTYPQHPFDHLQAGFHLGHSTKVSSLEVPLKTQFLCTMVCSHSQPPRPFCSFFALPTKPPSWISLPWIPTRMNSYTVFSWILHLCLFLLLNISSTCVLYLRNFVYYYCLKNHL